MKRNVGIMISFLFSCFVLTGCGMVGSSVEQTIKEVYRLFDRSEDESDAGAVSYNMDQSGTVEDGRLAGEGDLDLAGGETETLIEEESREASGETMEEEPVIIESVSKDKYVYQQLTVEEQRVYDQLYDATLGFREEVIVSTIDCDVIERAYAALQSDYADFFWIKGFRYTEYTRNGRTVKISVHPTYTMTQEEQVTAKEQIEQEAEEYLSLVPEEADAYTIEKIFYEELAERVDYDLNAENNQNIYSAFVTKSTVCQGFTRALQYLLEKKGIQSVNISGYADGENHAWNLVFLDGNPYYTDVTWGKTSCVRGKEDLMKVNYAWMNMTTEEIEATHTPAVDFELPVCSDPSMGYFVRENKYLDEMDPDRFGEMLQSAKENGDSYVVCQFASQELLLQYKQYFIEEQHIFDYYEVDTMNHSEDTMNRLLYFFPG